MKSVQLPTMMICLLLLGLACRQPPGKAKFAVGDRDGANVELPEGEPIIGPDGQPIVDAPKISIELAPQAASASMARLSHTQWENAVKDVLMLSAVSGLSKDFAPDPDSSAFGNNGTLFSVSSSQWAAYLNAAETLGDQIGKDQAAYKKLMPNGSADTKTIVTSFLKRAFRRPATAAEVTSYSALFDNGSKLTGIADAKGGGFSALITAAFQSPHFLYRTELGDATSGRYTTLTPYELASRLSFMIWNTTPDDALLKMADDGSLSTPANLKAQAKKMLDDPRGSQLLNTLHKQAYRIAEFKGIPQDAKKFPESAGIDAATLQKEINLFFDEILVTQGKGVNELFTSPIAFVNSKTAAAYEVSGAGAEFKKTDLDASQRAGYMTQLAFLSNYSKTEGLTSIIKRGHYVAETVLCSSFVGAPPTVEDTSPKDFKTSRERIDAQTKGCGGACHTLKINPPGYALDNFGPAGKWRTKEPNGAALDTSGTYTFTDGTMSFQGPVELMKEMVKRKELHQCYVRKMVQALYGRDVDTGDAHLIEVLGEGSLQGMPPKDIFMNILSDSLMSKRSIK